MLSCKLISPSTNAGRQAKFNVKLYSSVNKLQVKRILRNERLSLQKLKAVEETKPTSEVEEKIEGGVKEHEEVAKQVFEGEVFAGDIDATEETTPESGVSGVLNQLLKDARQELAKDDSDKSVLAALLEKIEAEGQSLEAEAAPAARTESKLKDAIRKCEVMANQMAELTQDLENYKRRATSAQARLEDQVKGRLVKELIPLFDNFELARTNLKAVSEGEQKIHNSYQALYKQLVDIIRALGVEAVPTVGLPFDPTLHEAILRAPSSEHPDGMVLKEFRKGFRLGETLLRPAMVQVSYDDSPAESSGSSSA